MLSLLFPCTVVILEINCVLGIYRTWKQIGSDINGLESFDYSASSVDLNSDGSIVAIGAPQNNDNGRNSGQTRVYKYNGVDWKQIGSDINGQAAYDYSGSSLALSGNGTILAIGAPEKNNGLNMGHVRVYKYNYYDWQQIGSDITGEASYDHSGSSVSLSVDNSMLAIGSPGNDGDGHYNVGQVRVYEYNGIDWQQIGSDIDGSSSFDYSGSSISLSGNGSILAIGAPQNNDNGRNSGQTRVYKYDGVDWKQIGSDINGQAVYDYSGSSVSLSGNGSVLAVGAPQNNGNARNAGSVSVYEYNGIDWEQIGNNIDGQAAYDYSGLSVSLSSANSILAIGAPEYDGNGADSGQTRVYEYNGIDWKQIGSAIEGEATLDNSGSSVSLNNYGDLLAVGAAGSNGNNGEYNVGHVSCFGLQYTYHE